MPQGWWSSALSSQMKMVRFLMLFFDSPMTPFLNFPFSIFIAAQRWCFETRVKLEHKHIRKVFRPMNIIHSSAKRLQYVTDVFMMLYEESDSLHRSSLSHIKDTFATQSGSGFRVRTMDGDSGAFCLRWNQRGWLKLTIWWKVHFIGCVAPFTSAEISKLLMIPTVIRWTCKRICWEEIRSRRLRPSI